MDNTNTNTTEARHRLHMAVTDAVRTRLERLRQLSEAESTTEVVRKSLQIYDEVLSCIERGGSVIFEEPDGSQARLKLI